MEKMTNTLPFFVAGGGLCIQIQSYVDHIFIYETSVTIYEKPFYIRMGFLKSNDSDTIIFDWCYA